MGFRTDIAYEILNTDIFELKEILIRSRNHCIFMSARLLGLVNFEK